MLDNSLSLSVAILPSPPTSPIKEAMNNLRHHDSLDRHQALCDHAVAGAINNGETAGGATYLLQGHGRSCHQSLVKKRQIQQSLFIPHHPVGNDDALFEAFRLVHQLGSSWSCANPRGKDTRCML